MVSLVPVCFEKDTRGRTIPLSLDSSLGISNLILCAPCMGNVDLRA